MKNIGHLALVLALLPLMSEASSPHLFEISTGQSKLTWEEFAENKSRLINEENGSLTTSSIHYAYRQDDKQLTASFTHSNGSVDYFGEKKSSIDQEKLPTTTDYTFDELELSYGHYFSADYITPFAYIMGGYQIRERIINPFPKYTSRTAEEYTFYFWGIGVDAELFKWNNFSVTSGIYFKNYTMGEVESIDKGFTKPLEQLRMTGYKLGIAYRFLDRYQASIHYLNESGSMNRSATYDYQTITNGVNVTIPSTQPESEQDLSQITLKVGVYF